MPIPTYEEVMLPLLKAIYDGNVHTNKECEEKLSKVFNLTESEVNEKLPSGKRKFYDRLNWAKTYLRNAELIALADKRGQFKITQEGCKLVESKPTCVNTKYLLDHYPKFVEYINRSRKNKSLDISPSIDDTNTEEIKTPVEKLEESYNEIREALRDELLEKLKQIDFYKFENVVIELIIKMGYGGSKVEAKESLTKKSNDEGIDGIINEDRLGLDRIYVQAKRWKDSTVGRPEVQKFAGALDGQGALKGIFITTSNFSKEAVDYSNSLFNKKIILIDGHKLTDLMIEFGVGVSTEAVYEIKRIDTDYFLDQ